MNPPEEIQEDFQTRRKALAAEISRLRGELAQAYLQLEKPIRYTEQGMKGFGFVRQNPWVITAVPATISLVSALWAWKKKKSGPAQTQSAPRVGVPPTAGNKMSRASQALMAGVEHGLRAYNLYRRVRSILP